MLKEKHVEALKVLCCVNTENTILQILARYERMPFFVPTSHPTKASSKNRKITSALRLEKIGCGHFVHIVFASGHRKFTKATQIYQALKENAFV